MIGSWLLLSTRLKRWILFICPSTRAFLRTRLFNSFEHWPSLIYITESFLLYVQLLSKWHSPQWTQRLGPRALNVKRCINSTRHQENCEDWIISVLISYKIVGQTSYHCTNEHFQLTQKYHQLQAITAFPTEIESQALNPEIMCMESLLKILFISQNQIK